MNCNYLMVNEQKRKFHIKLTNKQLEHYNIYLILIYRSQACFTVKMISDEKAKIDSSYLK